MPAKHLNDRTLSDIHKTLLERRQELVGLQQSMDESLQRMNEPSAELEESASKENLTREIRQHGETLQNEIRSVDIALTRMAEGDFGRCENCERPIRIKRLQAIPWTRLCLTCAQIEETDPREPIEEAAITAGGETATDDELCESILDELRMDGRVETEELTVYCEDGVIYLDGLLPNETEHQILLEVVHDTLETDAVEDSIRIDRQPWERRERRPDGDASADRTDALDEEEPDGDVEPYASLETGEPMAPPDELIPENIKR